MKKWAGRARRGAQHDNETSLALYDKTAYEASAQVIRGYSTSFGAGARLLNKSTCRHITSIYAMVRVADEIVDTYRGPDARELLDGFERDVHASMDGGFGTNLVAHAFGLTSRATGITKDLTEPFFASMRMDLETTEHTPASFDRYVYGSAEVIGEMCLAAFVATPEGPGQASSEVREGARRLGAAYQKINFLRDLATDTGELGRSYFPGVTATSLTDATLASLVDDCRADIRAAELCLPALPRRARIAVTTTIDIYSHLLRRIERTPASRLCFERVRVPNPVKAALAARNACPWMGATRRPA
ncbi:phytoene/squalene synthase family protein [Demequina lutea]|uniref:Phytoene/squalene synthetase n=1 Tax=Demequina lutea TaxID=431489 RepID=A0A7Y9Z9I5_9MICO|nr:squalene/phytoene synthase family protein [Demequina lutea]NYI39985.1 phytoene/squalene synthetase [Demequina lutea]